MSFPVWFHTLDLHLLYLINQTWSRPWLDPVMARVSDYDTFRYPIYAGTILTLIFGGFRGRLFLAVMAACLVIGSGLINQDFKREVNRPRPNETEPGLRVVAVSGITASAPHRVTHGNSFTSSHACNNVALAMVGCAIFGRWALWLWPWAAMVSYSRVYCGSHYPSDILAAWIVALYYSYFILMIAEWLWRKYAPRTFPNLFGRHPKLFPLRPRLLGGVPAAEGRNLKERHS